jgi:hypothetical protein
MEKDKAQIKDATFFFKKKDKERITQSGKKRAQGYITANGNNN